jgi:hypothetical protein
MVSTAFVVGAVLLGCQSSSAQIDRPRIVRLAELEIDPAQLELYRAALRQEIVTSIRVEPGVLTLYAVAALGRKGGSATTEAKQAASRANGAKGGRPKKRSA